MSQTIAPELSFAGTGTGKPDPVLLWDTFNAYQRTAALDAALELDLFTSVGEGRRTASQLAAACKGSERGVRILCDYLTTLGFFTKKNGEYELTPTSAMFLSRHSPHYKGSIAQFLNMPELMANYTRLADVIRRGKAAMDGKGTVDPEDPVWVVFAKSMAPMMGPSADFVAALTNGSGHRKVRVLDIAAGHGLFGIAVARQNPLAEVVALDWQAVLEVARENAREAGVFNRYQTIAGDAFNVDFKGPYDAVLLTNFLHHFSEAECVSLLRKVHASLRSGGRVVTLEFVPNDDRVTPPIPAGFSLIMLAGTPEGDAYTFADLDRMFKAAGFGSSKIVPVPESPQSAIVTERH